VEREGGLLVFFYNDAVGQGLEGWGEVGVLSRMENRALVSKTDGLSVANMRIWYSGEGEDSGNAIGSFWNNQLLH